MTADSRLTELLDREPFVLFDGAMGTMLQERGLDDGGAARAVERRASGRHRGHPRAVPAAGAQVLTTNTFGGTRPRLAMHGLEDRVEELSRGRRADRPPAAAEPYGALVAGDARARPASCSTRWAR